MRIIKEPTKPYVCTECGAEFFPDSKEDFKSCCVTKPSSWFFGLPIYRSYEQTYIECPFCKERIVINEKRYK